MADDFFPDAPPSPVSIEDQIACVEREIVMRRKVYPRWVGAKKMGKASADRELRAMEAVLDTLKARR
jgi:hypothetical protein